MNFVRDVSDGEGLQYSSLPIPLLVIFAPFIGLGYILIFPFTALVSIVAVFVLRIVQGLPKLQQDGISSAPSVQIRTKSVVAGLGNDLQSIINGLDSELIVINQDLRIAQYNTPKSHRNKALERAAIGRYCFEVTHGKEKPCESHECECPVQKVFETNKEALVTHYHYQNEFQDETRDKLVKVLALPIRDAHGGITQVAELIWNVESANNIAIS